MKKYLLALVILVTLLLVGCNYQGHEYDVLGYCEDDGLYYYTCDGAVMSRITPLGDFFDGLYWCPTIPEPTPEPTPIPESEPTPVNTPIPGPTPIPPEPLFMMWLLTRSGRNGDQLCMIISETHPSVERQQALCGWVATNAPCADYVYDDDTWSCDEFGGLRLPLYSNPSRDLMDVWNIHLSRDQ